MIYFIIFKYVKHDSHSNFNYIQVIKKHKSILKDDIDNY